MSRDEPRIMVVGAGIGGLSAALSLHEIGANVDVFESVREVRPLGVGINLLPHTVRELDALGLLEPLRSRSVEPTSLVYCSRHGQEIWREPARHGRRLLMAAALTQSGSAPRGATRRVSSTGSGPTISTWDTGLERIDADDTGATVVFATEHDGTPVAVGEGVVAADGIHSTARSQHYPSEGRPQWNGSLLWRGVAEVEPRTGRAHDGLGRSSRPEVRCLSDRRSPERSSNAQLHRRASPPWVPARKDRGLEPSRRADRLLTRFPRLGVRLARRSCNYPISTRDLPLPDGRSRPCGALDVRLLDASRGRGPSDVPDRLQRRVPGDPRPRGSWPAAWLPPATS